MRTTIFHATLVGANQQFSAPAAMTLLDAARAAGVTLPSSCRNGTCRTCRRLLRSGSVQYRIEWPGLSITQKEDGYVLPCVAYPLSDLVLDEPRAMIKSSLNSSLNSALSSALNTAAPR